MSRYIDADAAVKRFEELHGNENTLLNSYNADWIVSFIEDQPTADVQEVRHGRWDEIRDAYGHLEGWIHRDCGRMSMAEEKYCPTCGAIMDEEVKE